MNKTAIKNFAIWARVQLIEAAKQRAFEFEITENGENKLVVDAIGGRLLSKNEKEQRTKLIEQIRQKGYTQVMEEAAYTWFNRFIALRFMEVNGYLPSKVRVFTDETGAFKPEILKQAMSVEIEGLDRRMVLDLLDKQNNEELYKYLIITQCNALNTSLPYMFEKIANWTELLFPVNLLRADSILGQMVSSIPEEDWTDAVQIIGWLYQYYNSELKDETFALLKKNVKITKERIPAATQLFTPDWIVRYMVENSLGRLWYEGHKAFNKSQWKYYLDEAEQEPEVEAQLKKIRSEYKQIKPEDIKVIDPCMGSGHILVYAFDVLMQIYTSAGWSERDAAKSILENNLYGLDIDDRAGQLAYFAVMMKARKHSRRILNGEVKLNALSIQDSSWMTDEFIAYVAGKDANLKANLIMLRKTFREAKEYGSILIVPKMQYDALYERIDIISRSYAEDLFQAQYMIMAIEQLLPLIKQAQIMSQKYDVVVTNPPYMSSSGMSAKLGEFVKDTYPDSKSDLFSACIERGNQMTKMYGCNCMVTMQSWMFLSSFEKMRNSLLETRTIKNLMHMENMVMGIAFGTAVTTFWNVKVVGYKGTYNQIKLTDIVKDKPTEFPVKSNRFAQVSTDNFSKIPGSPIAYWIKKQVFESFKEKRLGDYYVTREGMATADNDRFLRLWFEPIFSTITLNANRMQTDYKWLPYNKGGEYRKWYGNNDYIVYWENDGFDIRNNKDEKTGRIRSHNYNGEYALKSGATWSALSSGSISLRYCQEGFLFDSKGAKGFSVRGLAIELFISLVNSKVGGMYLSFFSPTMDYKVGDVILIPTYEECLDNEHITEVTRESINLSRQDWDSFETSWDFKKHPLI